MTDYDAERFSPGNSKTEGKVGSLWAEVGTGVGFLILYERDPKRDPETRYASLKDIDYLGLDATNALALLNFLKRWESVIVKRVAEDAIERRAQE